MAYDEAHIRWNRWWLALWATTVAVIVPLAFLVPFRRWSLLAAALFGLPEAVGLLRHRDSLPPLTFVIRRYMPRWLTFTVMDGLLFAAGAWWLGFGATFSLKLGALGALMGWANNHFDVTYDT